MWDTARHGIYKVKRTLAERHDFEQMLNLALSFGLSDFTAENNKTVWQVKPVLSTVRFFFPYQSRWRHAAHHRKTN